MTINVISKGNSNSDNNYLLPMGEIVDCKMEVMRDRATGDVVTDSKSSDAKYLNLRLEILDRNMVGTNKLLYFMIGVKGNSKTVKEKGGKDGFASYGRESIERILCYNWDISMDSDRRTKEQTEKLSNIPSYDVLDGLVCKVILGVQKSEGYPDKNIVTNILTDRSIESTIASNSNNKDIKDEIPF